MSIKEHPPQLHVPVLLEKTLEVMQPKPNERYLDLTAGYGGHAKEFLARTKNYSESVLVDRDINAINELSSFSEKGARLLQTDFLNAVRQLVDQNETFDVVLADLGVSSPQLDRAERGFSFTSSGPLDMRMDDQSGQSAADIVNTYSQRQIVELLTKYGEERLGFARRIAQLIVRSRPINTTKELSELILSVHRGGWQTTHPATRTFQALRIVVNDELGQLEEILPLVPQLLNDGGRIGIISFHSLEDRIVKQYFTEQDRAGYVSELKLVTKKPIRGSTDDVHNPRARSSILRVAVKK